MTQSAIGGFFSGGGKGITWPDFPGAPDKVTGGPGRTFVTGTITAIHPPEPVLDPKTSQPVQPPKEQVRINLSTDERDGADDDGARTLYVKSWMRGAITDALRKAGESEPKVGGKLSVAFVRTEPPERPGLSASKHFEAQYEPPAATGGFFNGQQTPQQGFGNSQQPQQQFPQQTTMQAPQFPQTVPQAAQQAGAMYPMQQPQQQAPQQQAQPEPQRPPAISEQAWAQMDAGTRQAVANTMTGLNSPGQPGF